MDKVVFRLVAEEFELASGKRVKLDRWLISEPGEVVDATVPPANNLAAFESIMLFGNEQIIGPRGGPGGRYELGADQRVRCLLPFSLGEIDARGKYFGDAFVDDDEIVTATSTQTLEDTRRPEFSMMLARYARLRMGLNPPRDEMATRLWGLVPGSDGCWEVGVSPSRWSSGRTSMDSGGLRLELRPGDTAELARLAESLVVVYGNVTLREALMEEMRVFPYSFLSQSAREAMGEELSASGLLPSFASGACAWQLGTCSQIWSEADGAFVFTRRGRGVGGLNTGRVCAASGGVKWQVVAKRLMDAATKKKSAFFAALDDALMMETVEEIFRLGPAFTLKRLGFAREVPRIGSPEWFSQLDFKGTVDELVAAMAANEHEDAAEVDCVVYRISPEDVIELLCSPDGTNIIQYKGMMNFYLAIRAMNHPGFMPVF